MGWAWLSWVELAQGEKLMLAAVRSEGSASAAPCD